ncbi:hypothetical protein NEHOM01_2436 [Nematocida homosporus]|uniref:uncharacterized protein n=1 Tax=Nematocida homosporus TaxID=1912981 RepID=UPI00221FC26E|nr:uncharacterized protein NEHOM01_2436 [Nematocida homosporus]KAI5187900.1 hypothetical protein NEHOM01_2436 [Nematocida homosporus]
MSGVKVDSELSKEEVKVRKEAVERELQDRVIEPAEMETPPGRVVCEKRGVTGDLREIAQELINSLEAQGFLEKTKPSEWLSPLSLQMKPSGKWRWCADLRKLNDMTE